MGCLFDEAPLFYNINFIKFYLIIINISDYYINSLFNPGSNGNICLKPFGTITKFITMIIPIIIIIVVVIIIIIIIIIILLLLLLLLLLLVIVIIIIIIISYC